MRHTQAPPTPVVAGRCSLSGTLDIVGERWTLLLLREALMGATRFSEFRVAFPMASNLLTTRLSNLVEAGLTERVPLQQWGDQHLRGEYGPVATYRARDGRPVNGTVIDDSDAEIFRIGAETV
jgi:DNA-binding HxlR family transcriptional regulator